MSECLGVVLSCVGRGFVNGRSPMQAVASLHKGYAVLKLLLNMNRI
jgi:hypothetical protein